jgi:prophage regulatory protein
LWPEQKDKKKMVARILRRPEVETRTGLSRSTIYAMMADGTFPKPIRLGKRAVGWRESDIAEWLESRTSDAA